jgi:UDP-N-acetylmuramoyl-tripeptide--D-alanyl-D-alanine ligase
MAGDPAMIAGADLVEAAEGRLVNQGGGGLPSRAVIDSREVRAGDLFVGLPGAACDGGSFAAEAVEKGAWGVLVSSEWADRVKPGEAWVIGTDDPLRSLQRLARQRRRDLDCKVVGITGSNGKTTVKDICRALLGDETHASRENQNTEIGVPLTILEAPADTEFLVCEMGMRGTGQIGELCAIAEPDVGVVTNVGPVHLEILGTIEAIAAAKAEMLSGIKGGGTAVVPADAGYLGPHISGGLEPGIAEGVEILRFGPGGEVSARGVDFVGDGIRAQVEARGEVCEFTFPFAGEHNLLNALAAISVGIALGIDLATMARRASGVVFSRLRGELVRLTGGSVLINDCYNANPVSMRVALDYLSTFDAGRRLAVLGEMREIGPESERFHSEVASHARAAGVDILVGVGAEAKAYEPDQWFATAEEAAVGLAEVLGDNDVVLIKGSRSVGLEAVADRLTGEVT